MAKKAPAMNIINALRQYGQETLGDQGVEFDVRVGKRLVKVTMSDFEGNFSHYSIPLKEWNEAAKKTESAIVGLGRCDEKFVKAMNEFCDWLYECDEENEEDF